MPELPEVETVVTTLKPKIVGRTIEQIEVLLPKMIKFCDVAELRHYVIGQQILDIKRRGKYFIIKISDNWLIVGHLRMTGRLTVADNRIEPDKYTHVIFQLDNKTQLRFADMRQFGCLYLIRPNEIDRIYGLATIGPEPLAVDLSLDDFKMRFKNRKVKIKQLLLNQQFIAGIGNIYADEILFHAKINPNRPSDSLSDPEIKRIYESMRYILAKGVEFRGTSIKDYVDGFGVKGQFQNHLKVYGRTNEECLDCGTILTRVKITGRSTHYCHNCQK